MNNPVKYVERQMDWCPGPFISHWQSHPTVPELAEPICVNDSEGSIT
jgi:hypothetical protein